MGWPPSLLSLLETGVLTFDSASQPSAGSLALGVEGLKSAFAGLQPFRVTPSPSSHRELPGVPHSGCAGGLRGTELHLALSHHSMTFPGGVLDGGRDSNSGTTGGAV